MIKITLGQVCVKKSGGKFECRRIPYNMANKRMHWAAKSKWTNAWKDEVTGRVMEARRKFGKLPLKMPHITIHLYAVVQFDYDGAYVAVKPVLDGLKMGYAGVIEDDSPKFITLEVKQIKVGKKVDERVEIEFEERQYWGLVDKVVKNEVRDILNNQRIDLAKTNFLPPFIKSQGI